MQDLLAILKETEELFKVAEEVPNSKLALLMWKLSKASQLEEYYANQGNGHWSRMYQGLFETEYNELIHLGYAPNDYC